MMLPILIISITAEGWVSITLEFAVAVDMFFPFPFDYALDTADLLLSIGDISSVLELNLIGDELAAESIIQRHRSQNVRDFFGRSARAVDVFLRESHWP